MRKSLTISLRQRKDKLNRDQMKPTGQNSLTEIRPSIENIRLDFQYRPLGYSVIMNHNRSNSINRQVCTELNDECIFEIDEKIQKLVEQNERLSKSLQNKHSRNPSLVAGKSCQTKTESSTPQIVTPYHGIDYEKINLRMEKLEGIIESQHKEIDNLRSISQAQTERAQTRQLEDIENLIQKNQVYAEMITEQKQEIENYKHLTSINVYLQNENQELTNSIKVYDQKISSYQKSQNEIELNIQEVLKENKRLSSLKNEVKSNSKQNYDLEMKDKDEQISILLKEIETLASQLKIEEEENLYLRNMKIDEMKQMISSTQELSNTSMRLTDQKGRQKTENSFESSTSQKIFQINYPKRTILGDRQNEINKTLQRINSLSSIIIKQTKQQNGKK